MTDQKMKVRTSIEATITRADGTVIPLGTIHNTAWWWKFGPKQYASWRIRRANRSVNGNQNR